MASDLESKSTLDKFPAYHGHVPRCDETLAGKFVNVFTILGIQGTSGIVVCSLCIRADKALSWDSR